MSTNLAVVEMKDYLLPRVQLKSGENMLSVGTRTVLFTTRVRTALGAMRTSRTGFSGVIL